MTWKTRLCAYLGFVASPALGLRQHPVSIDASAKGEVFSQGVALGTTYSLIAGDSDQRSESLFIPALLYLFLPSAAVLFYFALWPLVVAGAVGLAVVLMVAQAHEANSRQLSQLLDTGPHLILAAMVAWLTGALPPFSENIDWYKHYAIFNAMASQPWPPEFITGDGISTLRYSLGYYVVPALAAKYFGMWVLPAAIFIWTTLGCYIALILAFGIGTLNKSTYFFLGSAFFFFSGADILGTYFTGAFPVPPMAFKHYEWWAYFGELPSSITSIIWTPQHAISGWISGFLILRYPRQSIRNAVVIVCTVALWSPFIAIGLIPIFIWAILQTGIRESISISNVIIAPVLLVSSAAFLTQGSEGIPFSFIWEAPDVLWHAHDFSVSVWLLFLLVEFVAIVVALLIIVPTKAMLIGIQCIFLLILCLFSGGIYNDLLMRASIPSLGILAILFSFSLVCAPNSKRKIPIFILFIAGLATPIGEIHRSINSSRIKDPNKISILDVIGENRALESQYLVIKNRNIPVLHTVLDDSNMKFTRYGNADFDLSSNRVSSDSYTDAALVSQDIMLPAGFYKLEVTLNWDVFSERPDKNGAHISLHGEKILIPIATSKGNGNILVRYFYIKESPFKISFGLGGWSSGKGSIQLKSLKLSPIQR